MTAAGLTVLTAMRDLASAAAAAMDRRELERRGTAPSRSELAKAAGVDTADLEAIVTDLKTAGLVTVLTSATSDRRVHVVTIAGHQLLADRAAAAALEVAPC